jgi:hypothetical protein
MVDEVRRTTANGAHTVELVMNRKENADAG